MTNKQFSVAAILTFNNFANKLYSIVEKETIFTTQDEADQIVEFCQTMLQNAHCGFFTTMKVEALDSYDCEITMTSNHEQLTFVEGVTSNLIKFLETFTNLVNSWACWVDAIYKSGGAVEKGITQYFNDVTAMYGYINAKYSGKLKVLCTQLFDFAKTDIDQFVKGCENYLKNMTYIDKMRNFYVKGYDGFYAANEIVKAVNEMKGSKLPMFHKGDVVSIKIANDNLLLDGTNRSYKIKMADIEANQWLNHLVDYYMERLAA